MFICKRPRQGRMSIETYAEMKFDPVGVASKG
jgi:hypothetical protein